jgi:hypothetical protein
MYIKIIDGVIEKYSIEQLRKDNPQVSFPGSMTEEVLAEFGVYPVRESLIPYYDFAKEKAEEGSAIQQEDVWVQSWDIVPLTPEEVEERLAGQSESIRIKRNQLLTDSDWTQVLDAPVNQPSWASYRQTLRDITTQEGFPWSVEWPTQP